MTSLGFKARFAELVERREKRQSIRANGDRFRVGGRIQLYTGMRTKVCRKLAADDPVCVSVEPIIIAADFVALGDWRIGIWRSHGFRSP